MLNCSFVEFTDTIEGADEESSFFDSREKYLNSGQKPKGINPMRCSIPNDEVPFNRNVILYHFWQQILVDLIGSLSRIEKCVQEIRFCLYFIIKIFQLIIVIKINIFNVIKMKSLTESH